MNDDLHLVRLILDRRALFRSAAQQHLHAVDDGYAIHAGLARLFATGSDPSAVPFQAFAVDDTYREAQRHPELIFLLAYSDCNEGELLSRMNSLSTQMVRQCASRKVPMLTTGTSATFRVRTCPVVRTKQAGDHGLRTDGKGRTKSREVDAWLAHRLPTWQAEPPSKEAPTRVRIAEEWEERQAVYRGWLEKELMRDGAASLHDCTMAAFQRVRMHRKAGPRSGIERPDVLLEGHLRVEQPLAFHQLLRRGIGRHRAFGFGMLLLRPA
jgi:CRISPR system Cascade subunit CasE